MKNRVAFAAPKSGSGKTSVTCGILRILQRRGLRAASCKCGPDYIDPMFHRTVLGIPSGNLDTFFTDEATTRYLLAQRMRDADITILEGVMGYYDGLGGQSEQASTYEVARVTKTPVILVVDAKGASVSLAAMIQGMISYREDSNICGILLNRVSAGYFDRIKRVIETDCGVPVLGYLPELKELQVPSRHLGLIAPEELEDFQSRIDMLADALESHVDVEALLGIAAAAEELSQEAPPLPHLPQAVRIGVARDEAFSFYYTENLELFRRMGAELVFFSPLRDKKLPEELDGLLLGGGYPEKFAQELEKNVFMRSAVREAITGGMPCLAECGGFLYLQNSLEDMDGVKHYMAGVLPGKGFRTPGLCRFGYVETEHCKAGLTGPIGMGFRGHEFHHWDCTENGRDLLATKPLTQISYPCMVQSNTLMAGFPHFYYYSNPERLYAYLRGCLGYQAGRKSRRHWDSIAKPLDSLGLLEENLTRICRITGDAAHVDIQKRALLVLCGDHGVVAEGVSQTGKEVTRIVAENFAGDCSTVNQMAAVAGVDVYTIDAGMDTEAYPEKGLVLHAVVDRKVARGTGNLAVEPAMTRTQCRQALLSGIRLVEELQQKGYRILATGEMGIGNTTATSVLAAILLGKSAAEVTGRGAGLSGEGLGRKIRAVERALARIKEALPWMQSEPLRPGEYQRTEDVLAQAGGLEIAMMAGVYLGGVQFHMPIVMDGVISSVAALTAMYLDPRVADCVIASHESREPAGRAVLEAIGVKAMIQAGMCLGEGTGAMTVFPLLDMAVRVYENMGTFTEYTIDPYVRYQ